MESRRLPGSGAGPSPDRLVIGSEGALGVITEAWMRLQGRLRFRGSAVFGFPDLFAAARAVRAVAQAGLYPSNLRVIDNDEAGTYGVNEHEESLLILGFESADHPVGAWMARAVELVQDHGGRRHAAEGAAPRWRTAFIRMPYARELTVPLGVINDTFESAVTWDRFEAFHAAVRAATEAALKEATGGRSGTVSTRFTHVYPDGPAPYYTFNVRGTPGRLLEQWRHIKARASEDRKSTRLNSSHANISYAVFCLKKKQNSPIGRGACWLTALCGRRRRTRYSRRARRFGKCTRLSTSHVNRCYAV